MIYICAYRDWGIEIYNRIKIYFDVTLINSKDEFEHLSHLFIEDDTIFFLGWSWIVDDEIINKCNCICLHPSPLPKYRGGSPIQNQIINDDIISAVTLFKMNEKLDEGDILFQEELLLDKEINDIFDGIIRLGIVGIYNILDGNFEPVKQDNSESTYYKRLTPDKSEITLDEIKNKPARYLYNKIRMLNDPYPNAYIKCKDGSKLYLTKSYYND
jgi:methionyl-tRNA formyltransferase|tara:strand:+ start:45 stop:686 length:642 start_codon:yes stop_codon:yes gene_type:complete